jgi:3-methyladenine DNA glycosylase/8-oxoguanine DNA glycosylase
VALVSRRTFEVAPPYSLSLTIQVLRRVPTNIVDQWAGGTYSRALQIGSEEYVIRVRQLGQSTLEVDADRSPEAVLPLVRRILGLDVDLSEALRLAAADSWLASIVQHLQGLRPPRFATLFETLGMTIPFQQVSLEAGQSFVNRLVETFGKSRGSVWLFPTPEAIADASIEDLRAAGLGGAKATSLRHAASLIVAGALSEAEIERLPTGEALRLLDDLPGVGPWTAGVILLRGFGRLDVFPPGDVGARRTLAHLLGRTTPIADADEAELLERLGPYRGLVDFLGLAWSRGLLSGGNAEGRPPYVPSGSAGGHGCGLDPECARPACRARQEHLPPSSGGSAMAQLPRT